MEFLKNLGIEVKNEVKNETPQADQEREIIVTEVLEATGLNWEVKKLPSQYDYNGEIITAPDSYHSVRMDNGHSFANVGKDYRVLQNRDAVAMTLEAGQELFDINGTFNHPWDNTGSRSGTGSLGSFGNLGGGSLKSGAAVFVQLALPDAYIGRSDIHRYISVLNTHDGSKSLAFGNGSQVVCCANTFAMAFKEISKIRHTASMGERIEEAKILLNRVLSFEDSQMQKFEQAAKIDFKKSHMEDVFNAIFGAANISKLNEGKVDEVSTRVKNQIKDLEKDIITSIDEQGSTLWALFNGVTRYTNHTRTAKDKEASLLMGGDAKINAKAADLIDSWVS